METSLLFYILLYPILGALINGLICFFGKEGAEYTQKHLGWSSAVFYHKTSMVAAFVAVLAVLASFATGVLCHLKLMGLPVRKLTQVMFTWIQSGSLQLDFAFQFDPLSAVMVLVVTGVGALIHIYSVGYMHGDPGFVRFFCYLNFFIFAMLMLVLGNNLLVLFIGWEGVGLASYLLIGFWYSDPEKARAGKKAFITNRIGDLGFVLGVLLLFALGNKLGLPKITLTFDQVNSLVAQVVQGAASPIWLTAAALLLFFGACGKSAQLPLYVWLPDAMAGPTPVSALIHAATMVTAGIYLVVRLSALYFAAPLAMTVVAIVGAATAIFAATIGLVQTDIKKVLAYSTVSQLGYMFLACGLGAPIIAMFHLVTHAFFKACLFLGSGSVIHGMGGEQNIHKMGGLKKYMPYTFWTFLIATLAIAGFPPLSGFVSKDEILAFAYGSKINGSVLLWAIGCLAALCTSFYMFRLVYLTFLGESRFAAQDDSHSRGHSHGHDAGHGHEMAHHVHESPAAMTYVLVALAMLSALGGLLAIPHTFHLHIPNYLEHWLKPLMPATAGAMSDEAVVWPLMGVSVLVAFAGLGIAYVLYGKKSDLPKRLASGCGKLYRLLYNKYYVDEIYEKLVLNPIYRVSQSFLFQVMDKKWIDGTVNGAASLCKKVSSLGLRLQHGDVQYYLLYLAIGLTIFSAVIFLGVK